MNRKKYLQVGMVHYAAPPIVGGVELTIFHHARVLTATIINIRAKILFIKDN